VQDSLDLFRAGEVVRRTRRCPCLPGVEGARSSTVRSRTRVNSRRRSAVVLKVRIVLAPRRRLTPRSCQLAESLSARSRSCRRRTYVLCAMMIVLSSLGVLPLALSTLPVGCQSSAEALTWHSISTLDRPASSTRTRSRTVHPHLNAFIFSTPSSGRPRTMPRSRPWLNICTPHADVLHHPAWPGRQRTPAGRLRDYLRRRFTVPRSVTSHPVHSLLAQFSQLHYSGYK
jgi:hypothetical protein